MQVNAQIAHALSLTWALKTSREDRKDCNYDDVKVEMKEPEMPNKLESYPEN